MTKRYKEYEGVLVNNLRYERPASNLEIEKHIPHFFFTGFNIRKNIWDNYIDRRKSRNKYWCTTCIECGQHHVVRADKISGKKCKHIGEKKP
ncbi:hypothetical protein LCGC14_1966920 [marine sediment metagenome]|uniref:Uncharacterized protein n=1 Tax=marine sediment metagenome TaxID=412755 RepID=A0A0F9HRB9_9ZZZZ